MSKLGLAAIAAKYGVPLHELSVLAKGSDDPRRRAAVCPHLTKDGEPATVEDSRKYKGLTWKVNTSGCEWACPYRPRDVRDGGWTADICLTSWHKDCIYKPQEEQQETPRWEQTASAGYVSRRVA
jgi:hypothetical protein